MEKFKAFGMKVLAGLVVIAGLGVILIDYESMVYITLGTLVMIAGATIYIFSDAKTYNKSVSSTKCIPDSENLSVERLYKAFKDMDSTLGKPWLGNIKLIKGQCLIFGPSADGDFIYAYRRFGKMFLVYSYMTSFITGPESELWRLERPAKDINIFDNKQAICYSLLHQTMLEDLCDIFTVFTQEGKVLPLPNEQNLGKLYRFDEDFKLTGQTFTLEDFDDNIIYDVEATFPLKSFYLRDHNTQEEVFYMTKRLLNVLAEYDFYSNGEKYGTFKKQIDLTHDTFEMQTADGLLEMRSINDKFGTNYIVKVDGKVIGSIAERFTLSIHNIVFDNFILHVRQDKYTALLTALAVMAARELARDRTTHAYGDFDDD